MDDATSAVTQAVFHPSEETRICLAVLEGLVRQWEIPLALYSNRHAAFKYNAHQGPVLYEFTQVARVMGELGIQQIFAMSPQAKSRGLSLSPFTRALGMSRVATRKYALAKSPLPNCSLPRSTLRVWPLSWPNHRWPQINPSDIVAFQ
ncbi:MAG: hypothetical protein F4X65_14910 [Chloroflexi bacterium]|nr:hypothetical protein [Chloroflexota bacterium]